MDCVFEERSSKGIVKDYYSQMSNVNSNWHEAPYVYKTLMDMCEADPLLFNAISLTVDLATYKGYEFIGEESKVEKAKKQFNEEFDFDQIIDNIIWQLLVYGDAYLELVWNTEHTKVMELHPLETTEMVIRYDDNGEISGYMQKVAAKSEKDWVKFKTDEVVYFRGFWIGTQVYSRSPFKAISRAYACKVYANDYLSSIFRNMPPKMIYFLKNANEKQRKAFFENLIRAKTNPGMDIVATGEAFESIVGQVKFDDGLMAVLDYLRKEVLMITRVPPHWIGILDGANRGIGENVVIPYETKIKKLQQKIASQINKELLPLLGLSELEFRWNAISLLDEKSVIDMMGQLKSQGFDSETIIDFAKSHGVSLRNGAEIEKPEVMGVGGSQIQDDSAPSRQRNNPKTSKMGQGMDKKGVSSAGKAKLDAKKVI